MFLWVKQQVPSLNVYVVFVMRDCILRLTSLSLMHVCIVVEVCVRELHDGQQKTFRKNAVDASELSTLSESSENALDRNN